MLTLYYNIVRFIGGTLCNY